MTYAEQALAITPSGRERADLLRQAGQSATDVANGQRAVEYFDEAIATYRELGDVASAASVTAQSLRPLRSLDRTGEAAERSEAALAELGDDGDERVRGEIYRSLAEVRWAMGSLDEALVWTERTLTLAEKLDLPELFTGALGIRAAILHGMGRRREATIANEGVLAFAEESGHQRDVRSRS